MMIGGKLSPKGEWGGFESESNWDHAKPPRHRRTRSRLSGMAWRLANRSPKEKRPWPGAIDAPPATTLAANVIGRRIGR